MTSYYTHQNRNMDHQPSLFKQLFKSPFWVQLRRTVNRFFYNNPNYSIYNHTNNGLYTRRAPLVACLLLILVILSIINRFDFFSNNTTLVKQREQLNQIQGFYPTTKDDDSQILSNSSAVDVKEWWRCSGSDYYRDRIIQYNMEVHQPPFSDPQHIYYIRSCIQALKKKFFPQIDISDRGIEFKPYYGNKLPDGILIREGLSKNQRGKLVAIHRLEIWKDYSTGIHGFVDFIISLESNSNNKPIVLQTVEFDDNQATELHIQLNDFEEAYDSKVWFITTTYNRPVHFKRFLSSVQELWLSGETSFGVCLGMFKGDESNSIDLLKQFYNNDNSKSKNSWPPIRQIFSNPPFKKAPLLQQCLDTLDENDIAFMMDVDVTFDEEVLKRLRRYVAKRKRLWSPIIYYRGTDEEGRSYKGNPSNIFAYGGTGYDVKTFQSQHGFEDTDFFFRARYLQLQIARTEEPNLQHWPHARDTWQRDSKEVLAPNLCNND